MKKSSRLQGARIEGMEDEDEEMSELPVDSQEEGEE